MRILHTADWHIGKLIYGLHMTEDQAYVLEQIKKKIKEVQPDVLLIAGDIYDRSVPPTDAVELLDDFLSYMILEAKIPVIIISGNHDNGERLSFGSRLLREKGLYIRSTFDETPIIIKDAYGPVHFYPIPYMEPAIVRQLLGDDCIKSHDDSMKALTSSIDVTERSVCLAHCFVIGSDNPETSDSERPLSIGGSEYVSVSHFEKFNYTALGHLHKPQKVKHEFIRYAGSLMKYSFSEAEHHKSLTLVELDSEGNVSYEKLTLTPLRDMRRIKGRLEELIKEEVYGLCDPEDYLMATLTDKGALIDPIHTLRQVYPNILKLEREENEGSMAKDNGLLVSDFKQKTPLQLFELFYEKVADSPLEDEDKRFIEGLMNKKLSEQGGEK